MSLPRIFYTLQSPHRQQMFRIHISCTCTCLAQVHVCRRHIYHTLIYLHQHSTPARIFYTLWNLFRRHMFRIHIPCICTCLSLQRIFLWHISCNLICLLQVALPPPRILCIPCYLFQRRFSRTCISCNHKDPRRDPHIPPGRERTWFYLPPFEIALLDILRTLSALPLVEYDHMRMARIRIDQYHLDIFLLGTACKSFDLEFFDIPLPYMVRIPPTSSLVEHIHMDI
jgi:hypothetical protein